MRFPEIITDGTNGTLIPPNDPESMANAILNMLKNSETLKTIGETNQHKAKSLFRTEVMTQKLIDLYKELLI